MVELDKKEPATMEELLVGSFAAADALGEATDRKRNHHREGIL
jgi:hypothetical protein